MVRGKTLAAATGGTVAGAWDPATATREMMRFAMQENFTAGEFRSVFGSSGEILGQSKAEDLVREAYDSVPGAGKGVKGGVFSYLKGVDERAVSMGRSQLFWGGPSELRGAGVKGSLEPRIFEQLTGEAWGGTGETIKKELYQRLEVSNAHKLQAHGEITKTLQSLSGQLKPSGTVMSAMDMDPAAFRQFMEKGGGFMDLGKGMGTMYVPNATAMDALQPYTAPGGQAVYSDLSRIYTGVHRAARGMGSDVDPISEKTMTEQLGRARYDLYKHWAPGGKGAGAYMRGKQFGGSRFLEVASKVGNVTSTDPYTGVIGRGHAKRMAKELYEQDIITQKQLNSMLDIAAGKSKDKYLHGMVARHPMFGQFSAQAMRFRVADIGDSIILPAMQRNISFEGLEKQLPVALGTLTGMAADKDGDIAMAMLMGPDSSAKIKNLVTDRNNKYMQEQVSHTLRMQLIKAQRGADSTTMMQFETRMMADVQKMSLSQKQIPLLSTQLSRARAGVMSQLSGREARDSRFLLEWLEQTPISAKHIDPKLIPEGNLSGMYASIAESFKGASLGDKDAERQLIKQIQNMTKISGGGKDAGLHLLTGDLTLTKKSSQEISEAIGGGFQMRRLQGIDVENTVSAMFRGIREFDNTADSKYYDSLMARARTSGKQTMSASESSALLVEYAKRTGRAAGDIGAGAKGYTKVSRAAIAGENFLGAMGRGMLKHKKLIGFGFAGSLLIGAALSSPTKSLGPGSRSTAGDAEMVMKKASLDARSRAADRVTPDSLHPQTPPIGQPSAPNMPRGGAMIGSPMRKKYGIRGAGRGVNASALSQGLSGMTGGRGSVNVNITTRGNHANNGYRSISIQRHLVEHPTNRYPH